MNDVIRFATLYPDGSVVDGLSLKKSSIAKCKFFIFDPLHYREDGSCKCDDAEHRKFMIKEWEYTKKDFKDIPLRKDKK